MEKLGYQYVTCGVVGLLVSLCLAMLVRNRAIGNGRGAEFHHKETTAKIPRLGGICIVGGFVAACIVAGFLHKFTPLTAGRFWVVIGSSLAIFAVGIFDDLRPLGAKRKLLAQILIAAGTYALGVRISQVSNPFTGGVLPLGVIGFFITVFWLVAMTNLINLIDGIDGLAGGIGIMLMGLLAYVGRNLGHGFYSLLCLGVIGSLLGFLRFNFPPAKIYMGDGGAYFLGFFIGVFSIETSNKGTVMAALAAPALALALPILDTTLALLRRGLKGLPLFRPDLDHIHHKLVKRGITRTRAVLTLYLFSVVSLCIAVAVFVLAGNQLPVFIGFAALALIVLLHFLKVIPEFWTVGSVVQANWRLRRLSRSILAMSSWLEENAEDCRSMDELWKSFTFFLDKLGLSRVKVHLEGLERTWHSGQRPSAQWDSFHQFGPGRKCSIEFYCDEERLTRREFDHVTELVAEAWLKAVTRWEQAHRKVASFDETAGTQKAAPLVVE